MNKRKEIYKYLNVMALEFNQVQKPERLKIYSELLEDFPLKKIEDAIKWCMLNLKFFPQLAEIRERIVPKVSTDDNAVEMASKIIDCISRFGSYRELDVKEHLGTVAWFAVVRFGGWNLLCKTTNDQMTATRAQLRQVCKSVILLNEREPNICEIEFNSQGKINHEI